MKKLLSTLFLSAAFAFSGCATVYRMPEAKALPREQLAILEDNSGTGSDVIVFTVDGRDRGAGFFKRFELAPGRRAIGLSGNVHGGMYADERTLYFTAEAGKVYELKTETIRQPQSLLKPSTWERGRWRAWIIDKGTGKRVDEGR